MRPPAEAGGYPLLARHRDDPLQVLDRASMRPPAEAGGYFNLYDAIDNSMPLLQ